MSVFKAYDLRGTYPDEIDENLAGRIGVALTRLLSAKTLVVGRDMRDAAPSVQRAVIDGIRSQGCDVIDIGLVSTPMGYYAIGALGADGGVVITASHNPAKYIGAKLCRKGAVPMSSDTGIRDLEAMVAAPQPEPSGRPGRVRRVDIAEDYQQHVQTFAEDWTGLNVVIDTANGMGGLEIPLVLRDVPLEWKGLYLELDGNFPHHEANPLKDENVADLRAAVLRARAHAGFGFDGDADRCCVLDERGERVGSDLVTALLAREFLRREPGAAIVYDLRSTRALPEDIEKAGGRPIRERVGHSFIKATMRRVEAPFAGELSGHFYFRDHYYSDCASLAMVLLLNLMARERRPLSNLVQPLRRYASTGEINFHVADPRDVLEDLRARYRGGRIDDLDGVTVTFDDYWFNVRMSNTEPLIRLRLEAASPELLQKRLKELVAVLGAPEA